MRPDPICPVCSAYALDYELKKGYKKCLSCRYTYNPNEGRMITKDEILKGRDKEYPNEYTKDISDNIDKLLIVLNKIRKEYGQPMTVASGWRPSKINESTSNAAKKSNHLLGLAVDIRDIDGKVMRWCLNNLKLLSDLGVYLEDFRYTPSWVHFQIVPPKSHKRIYVPSSNPASANGRWDGNYDVIYDY